MSLSSIAHSIKHREKARDDFCTPDELAKKCIGLVPIEPNDALLDPAVGYALGAWAFYSNFPAGNERDWCDKGERDFLHYEEKADWIITNPPYSDLDNWFKKATQVATKGFAFLLGIHNLTPRRIEIANRAGFGLTFIHLCKVFHWFGISCFCVFEKDKANVISYDRVVWRNRATVKKGG